MADKNQNRIKDSFGPVVAAIIVFVSACAMLPTIDMYHAARSEPPPQKKMFNGQGTLQALSQKAPGQQGFQDFGVSYSSFNSGDFNPMSQVTLSLVNIGQHDSQSRRRSNSVQSDMKTVQEFLTPDASGSLTQEEDARRNLSAKSDKDPHLSVVPGSVANIDTLLGLMPAPEAICAVFQLSGYDCKIGKIFDKLTEQYGDLKQYCEGAGVECQGSASFGALQHNGPLGWARYYCAGEDGKLDDDEKAKLIKIVTSFAGPEKNLKTTMAGPIQRCMSGFAGVDDVMSSDELDAWMKTLDLYDGDDNVLQDLERESLDHIVHIGFRSGSLFTSGADPLSNLGQMCMIKFQYHLFMAVVNKDIFFHGSDHGLVTDGAKTMRTIVNTILNTHIWVNCNDKTGEDLSSGPRCQESVNEFGNKAAEYAGDKELTTSEVKKWCYGEFPQSADSCSNDR